MIIVRGDRSGTYLGQQLSIARIYSNEIKCVCSIADYYYYAIMRFGVLCKVDRWH